MPTSRACAGNSTPKIGPRLSGSWRLSRADSRFLAAQRASLPARLGIVSARACLRSHHTDFPTSGPSERFATGC